MCPSSSTTSVWGTETSSSNGKEPAGGVQPSQTLDPIEEALPQGDETTHLFFIRRSISILKKKKKKREFIIFSFLKRALETPTQSFRTNGETQNFLLVGGGMSKFHHEVKGFTVSHFSLQINSPPPSHCSDRCSGGICSPCPSCPMETLPAVMTKTKQKKPPMWHLFISSPSPLNKFIM